MKHLTTLLLFSLLLSVLASCQGAAPTATLPASSKETAPLTEETLSATKEETKEQGQTQTLSDTTEKKYFLTYDAFQELSHEEKQDYAVDLLQCIKLGVGTFRTGPGANEVFNLFANNSESSSHSLTISKEVLSAVGCINCYDQKTWPLLQEFLSVVKNTQERLQVPLLLAEAPLTQSHHALLFLNEDQGAHIFSGTLIRFFDHGSIREYTIPKSVDYVASGAFSNNSTLQTVELNDRLSSFPENIGALAFENCPALKTIRCSKEVTALWSGTDRTDNQVEWTLKCELGRFTTQNSLFSDADVYSYEKGSIEDLELPIYDYRCKRRDDLFVTQPIDNDPDHFVIRNGVLIGYLGLGGHVIIPEGVTEIRGHVFTSVRNNLLSVTLPSTLKKICSYAFVGCFNVPGIVIPQSVEEIEAEAFLSLLSYPNPPEYTVTYVIGVPKTCKVAENAFYFVWPLPQA